MKKLQILYLHGLDSSLQDDRRTILEQYAKVYSPNLQYKTTPNLFKQLCEKFANVDAFIGSSAGGLVGYYLSHILQKPCLLFNPALPFRDQMPIDVQLKNINKCLMQVVIGFKDEIVPYRQSLEILEKDLSFCVNLVLHMRVNMQHSYGIDVFAQECNFFFKMLMSENH